MKKEKDELVMIQPITPLKELIISKKQLSSYKDFLKESKALIVKVPTLGFGTIRFVRREQLTAVIGGKTKSKKVWCLEMPKGVLLEI